MRSRVPLDHARGYRVDWDRVEAAHHAAHPPAHRQLAAQPHRHRLRRRPTSPRSNAWCARHGIFLLSDEVYEHIVFDGGDHLSVAGSATLAARTFVISSFGKTFHTTGWKIGTCCAPVALSDEFRKVHQFNVFAVNHPMQAAIARFLADPAPYQQLGAFYQAKRDHFLAGLAATRLRALPCPGTYFVLADYRAVSDEPEAVFARRLVERHGVAAIPVCAFYRASVDHGVVRLCFGKRRETLDAALERLARV